MFATIIEINFKKCFLKYLDVKIEFILFQETEEIIESDRKRLELINYGYNNIDYLFKI